MIERDLYQTLDVDSAANEAEIKRAYRRQAHLWHPDRHPGQPDINKRFMAISEAYTILSNPESRKKYDQLRSAKSSGKRVRLRELLTKSSSGINTIFDTIFGLDADPGLNIARERAGQHIHTELFVPFVTAVFGGERQITITREERCPNCDGRGYPAGQAVEPCGPCSGTGRITGLQGNVRRIRACPECGGRGSRTKAGCVVCKGKGKTARKKTIGAPIPAGIREGETIRLRDEGEPGAGGGPDGDLIVRIFIEPDPHFIRRGNDLAVEQEISLEQAVLGANVQVRTLEGSSLELTVPPGTQPDDELEIPGYGLPVSGAGHRGKLIVKLKVRLPGNPTPRQRAAFEKFLDELE